MKVTADGALVREKNRECEGDVHYSASRGYGFLRVVSYELFIIRQISSGC